MAEPPDGAPEIILIAPGSEVSLAVKRTRRWSPTASARASSRCRPGISSSTNRRNIATMCCRPTVNARIAIEQGSTLGLGPLRWPDGSVIGMKTFGASAPLKELQRKFGFEPERVVARHGVARPHVTAARHGAAGQR